MKVAKKILIALLVFIVVLIAAAAAIPFVFKDKILATAKEEINNNLNAKVDFKDVSLSLFRSFPNFSFKLSEFSVTGINDFEGIRLAAGESVDFTLNLMSVLRGGSPIGIQSVNLTKPEINILVLEDGRANYDITKPAEVEDTTAAPPPSNIEINLKSYSITDGNIIYDDRAGDTYVNIKGLNHKGSGNFTLDVYDLDTQTDIEAFTVRQGAVAYLKEAHTQLNAIFNIDQANSKYTLKDNELKINELTLNADGYVQLSEGDDIGMDLSFSTPQNQFKQLWSLIPNAYIQGYENVKADGSFELSGMAKGNYNGEREEYPAFNIHLKVDGANVKYPDLPLGISNINALVDVNSPTSSFDDLTVDAPKFSLRIGQNPIDAKFKLKTPISDPDIDAVVNGVLNLSDLSKAFPIEGVDHLSGIIKANVKAQTRMSYIDNQEYERVNMNGNATITGLNYRAKGTPPVTIKQAQMEFSPQRVQLDQFDAQLGKSDIQARGAIDNILAYFSPKKTMTGQLTLRSHHFDANEWLTEPTASAAPTPAPAPTDESNTTTATEKPFDRFDFTMDAEIGEIVYEDYHIKNAVTKGRVKPNRMEVQALGAEIGESDIMASGVVTNAFDYLFDDGVLGGDIILKSNLLNLNQFMAETPSSVPATQPVATEATAALEPIVVPENIRMNIFADMKKVIYTNMELNDLKGRIVVENQSVVLDETTARTLGGTIGLAGSYASEDKKNPTFNMKLDLNKMQFQKAFNTFNSFQQLAPIGKFLEGIFSTSFIMNGQLGADMMPKLNTLNVEGFIETINAVVNGFKPLQAVGNALNVDYLKNNLKITNSKNWFEIKDGAIELKEFDYKVKDIDMKIGGRHGLTQDMDYKIKARIPRKLLENNAAGAAVNSGLAALQGQASKLGVNLKQSEFVNVLVNLTGTIASPKVKLQLLGGDGEMTIVDAAKQEAKEEINKKIDEGKQIVTEKANKALDTAKTVINKEVEKAKEDLTKKAQEAAKDKLGSVLDSTAQKKVDKALENVGKEGADKIKDNLDKFNPFKKKKDGGGN